MYSSAARSHVRAEAAVHPTHHLTDPVLAFLHLHHIRMFSILRLDSIRVMQVPNSTSAVILLLGCVTNTLVHDRGEWEGTILKALHGRTGLLQVCSTRVIQEQ
jgi:hypothetical protein